VLLYTLQVDVIIHLEVVALEIEFHLFGKSSEAFRLEMSLVLEQQIVHASELALRGGGFCGFRG
jgi:hypothetical protein